MAKWSAMLALWTGIVELLELLEQFLVLLDYTDPNEISSDQLYIETLYSFRMIRAIVEILLVLPCLLGRVER